MAAGARGRPESGRRQGPPGRLPDPEVTELIGREHTARVEPAAHRPGRRGKYTRPSAAARPGDLTAPEHLTAGPEAPALWPRLRETGPRRRRPLEGQDEQMLGGRLGCVWPADAADVGRRGGASRAIPRPPLLQARRLGLRGPDPLPRRRAGARLGVEARARSAGKGGGDGEQAQKGACLPHGYGGVHRTVMT